MRENYSDWYSQIESLLGKKILSKQAFHFSIKAAPRRPFSVTKTDGKIQIILDQLDPSVDRVGSVSYQNLGATKSADKFIMIYTVSGDQLIPVFGQIAELLPVYLDSKTPDTTGQLLALGTAQFAELRFGNYQEVLKLGSGTFFQALSNLNLKNVRYDVGDIITEAEHKKLESDHYRSKFVRLEIKISETVPKEQIQIGAPLSTKTGWAAKANIETKDGVKFVRGQIYSEEEMKKCPEDKRFKFIQTGMPNVVPEEVPA
jgi:hypothetical protein